LKGVRKLQARIGIYINESRGEKNEEENWLGGYGVIFRFVGIVELYLSPKNSHHKRKPAHTSRNMGGLDELE
jgi:hypothetical protein